jgi:hypothetical protein
VAGRRGPRRAVLDRHRLLRKERGEMIWSPWIKNAVTYYPQKRSSVTSKT